MHPKSVGNLPCGAGVPFLVIGTMLLTLCFNGCSRQPPLHGTELVVVLETDRPTNYSQLLSRTQTILSRRLERLNITSLIEPTNDGRLSVKIPRLNPDEMEI